MRLNVRCTFSDLYPKRKGQFGTIVGESRDGRCWWVLIEGHKNSQAFSKSYIWPIGHDTYAESV